MGWDGCGMGWGLWGGMGFSPFFLIIIIIICRVGGLRGGGSRM